jgi:hypothetical protein
MRAGQIAACFFMNVSNICPPVWRTIMKTSILVSVGAIGALTAAMVLASPMSTDGEDMPSQAPNRAEAYEEASCGGSDLVTVSQAQGWHTALGSKRALDRALVLASADGDLAGGCAAQGE